MGRILAGDPRFEFRRQLGEGGYGTVFEAWDHTRAQPVAVKRLHKTDTVALLQNAAWDTVQGYLAKP